MPRVTDFPDQTQSMLNTVLNNRAMNLQSDQAYLDSAAQTESLRQSMLGMVMDDAFSRDALAQDASQFEQSVELEKDRNLLGWAQLGETERSNKEGEKLTLQKIELAKDQFKHMKGVDEREAGMAVLDRFERQYSDVMNMQGQLAAYANKVRRGDVLTGEDMADISNLQEQVRVRAALGHDMIANTEDLYNLDPAMAQSLSNAFKPIIFGETMNTDFAEMNRQNQQQQALLQTPRVNTTQESGRFGAITEFARNALDSVNRLFTSRDNVPIQTRNTFKDLTKILEGEKETFSTREQARVNESLLRSAELGMQTFGTGKDLQANQIRNLHVAEEMEQAAIYAKILSDNRAAGIPDDRLGESLSNPVVIANARNFVLPEQIKNYYADNQTIDRLLQVQAIMGRDHWNSAVSGNPTPAAMEVLSGMGMHLGNVRQYTDVLNRIQSGNTVHADPRKIADLQEKAKMLSDFGTIYNQQ